MQTISSSCYDAIIIKQENRVYKSTPFQVVFSNSLIKQIERNKQKIGAPYELSLHVNDRKVDIPIKIDLTGRVVFEKVFVSLFRGTIENIQWFQIPPMFLTMTTRRNHQLLTRACQRANQMEICLKTIKISKLLIDSGNSPGSSTKKKTID